MIKRVLAGVLAAGLWSGANATPTQDAQGVNHDSLDIGMGGLTAHFSASWISCDTCNLIPSGDFGVAFVNGGVNAGLPFVALPGLASTLDGRDLTSAMIDPDLTVQVRVYVTDDAGLPVNIVGGTFQLTGLGYIDENDVAYVQGLINGPGADPGPSKVLAIDSTDNGVLTSGTLTLSFPAYAATDNTQWEVGPDIQSGAWDGGGIARGGYVDSFTFDVVVQVPEPASFGLMVAGLGAIAIRRRSKKR